jgi:N-acetylmuramoyl-L-alanine amidase
VPIHHPPPYTIAIDAGHGGPYYLGATAVDSDGRQWLEKDLTLAVALRVNQLLAEAGYNPLLLRTTDAPLTAWNPYSYRSSMIAELQERVNRANAAGADVLLSIHFNGWVDGSQRGTEAYCNPDRTFGTENCMLALAVQQGLVNSMRAAGYDVSDRGVKNDAGVNGDPRNPHSFLLGTNDGFSPSLMPGTIAEALFLSNPDDLAFLHREDAIEVIAKAFVDGLNAYFFWLNGG